MGKTKKGKKADPEKKAALQSKKEAKAEKATRKRLEKESTSSQVDAKSVVSFDSLLLQYQQVDQKATTTIVETVSGFPPARANASLALYDNTKKKELYLFGGEYYDGVENIVLLHLYKYDIANGDWKRIMTPTCPPPRCAHSCVVYNHALYIFGGEMATADQYYHYKDLWKFDIPTLTWTELKPSKVGTIPTARSGHAAVGWKHYMIVFGGFYEALRDTPRWFNDVTVLNLQTQTWMDVPHSKLTSRPEPRSACNVSIVGDDLIVQGGFSKLPRTARSSADAVTSPETKVHTDAWRLQLKPLLQNKPPTWERLTSSVQRAAWLQSRNPIGRSGTARVAYKNRMLVYGGVVDKEHFHHKVESVFYNDLHAFDVERRKWFPVLVKQVGCSKRRRRAQPSEDANDDEKDESSRDEIELAESDMEDDTDEKEENEPSNTGWDISKLRSNMFAFLDGNGNLVYEKIEEEPDDRAGSSTEKQKEEMEEVSAEESEEEKEESKADNSAHQSPAGFHAVNSSSVMTLNPGTNVPEAIARTEPLPRIKASMVVNGHTLILYGGLLEIGDREITLDDMWTFDLRKRDGWTCVWEGTMHKQVWRGAIFDDDDSYVSADLSGTGNDDDGDDEGSSGDDDEPEELKEDEEASQSECNEDYDLGTADRTPQAGETLAEFYARTSYYWNTQAAQAASDPSTPLSAKELKREGFALARIRYEELEPVTERLHELDLDMERTSGKSDKKERKSDKKHSSRKIGNRSK